MAVMLLPLHLGALHPMETVAMAALALGPFVILAVVVKVVSRRDRRSQADEDARAQATREGASARDDTGSTTTDTAAPQ
jgi:flagellar biosynthesis/type III secretory pathway M-ring protein FliF/YscJ